MLFTVLLFIVSFVCGVWQLTNNYAHADDEKIKYELTNIEVTRNEGWIITAETPADMLYKIVSVTVTYGDKENEGTEYKYALELSGEKSGDFYVSKGGEVGGEKVKFAREGGRIAVTLELPKGAEFKAGVTGEATADLGLSDTGSRTQNGIFAEYVKGNQYEGSIHSYTTPSNTFISTSEVSAVNVYLAYNDGSHSTERDIQSGKYQLTGNFFPEDLAEYLKAPPSNGRYNKTLTVSEINGSYSTTVDWEEIIFDKPAGFGNTVLGKNIIRGTLAQQYARSELNLDGLEVTLVYVNGRTTSAVEVPLSTFAGYIGTEYFKVTYFRDNDGTDDTGDDNLTTEVKSIEITLVYPGESGDNWTTSNFWQFISVAPLAIHAPKFTDSSVKVDDVDVIFLSWDGKATVNIEEWDYSSLFTDSGDAPDPIIKATVSGTDEVYTSDSKDESKKLKTSLSSEGIMTVEFPRPGVKYLLTMELPNGGDFQWATPEGYVLAVDNYTLQVTVQVEKGQPEITFDGISGTFVYGTPNGEGAISATIEKTDMATMGITWSYEKLDSKNPNDHKKHENDGVYKYYLKYYTSYTSETVNVPVSDADLRKNDGKPKTVGKYYVVAYTYENFGYKSAVSNALPFEVTQFQIETKPTSKVFARTEWSVDKFLSNNDDLPYAGAPYNETAFDILTIRDSSGTVDASKMFYKADTYTVTVSINSADSSKKYSTNYKLASGSVTFSITTNKESEFDFEQKGWTYGATDAYAVTSVSKTSTNYYPSWTVSGDTVTSHSDIENNFTIAYYYNSGAKKGQKVDETNLSKFEVGDYIVELTAKADESYKSEHPDFTETAALTEGAQVDYVLPVVRKEFSVTADSITAPTLAAPWADSLEAEGEVYKYNDKATNNYKEYIFTNWIANNEAANGDPIITVTVTYTKYATNPGNPNPVTFADGKFKVGNAGHYVVTISLNKNYSWKTESPDGTSSNQPYYYYGYVARQQLTVLQGSEGAQSDISGADDTYTGSLQEKTIGNWNSKALTITGVTGTVIGGSSSVTGEIKKPDNTNGPDYSNKFSVTGAGDYEITIEIADKDNYEWIDNADTRVLTLEYTLKQATLKVTWADDSNSKLPGTVSESDSYPTFVYDGTAKRPTATANVAFDADNAEGMLTITGYKLYTDKKFGTEAAVQTVKARGVYYIAVSDFGGSAAVNYVLPNPLIAEGASNSDVATMFEITALKLDAPLYAEGVALQGKEISETYKGLDYDVTEYIHNYYSYYNNLLGSNGEPSIQIKINGTQGTKIKTYRESGYTVTISVNSNDFEWKEGAEKRNGEDHYTFTFIINQRMVIMVWSNTTVTYNPNGITQPTCKITNIAPDGYGTDKVSVVLTYTQGDSPATLEDAGNYTVHANSLTGDDAYNYKIVDGTTDGTSNNSSLFTVRKLEVKAPGYNFGSTDFNGTEGILTINTEDGNYNEGYGNVQISVEYVNSWLTGSQKLDKGTYTFADKKVDFRYTQAGDYTFTFKISAKNYYWEGTGNATDFDCEDAQYTYGTTAKLTVNRVKLTAPDIKAWRSQEWSNPQPIEFDYNVGFNYNSQGYTVNYKVKYGNADDAEPTFNEWPGNERGVYYAHVYLDASSDIDILNYEWIANPNDPNNGSSYLKDHADIIYYAEGKVAIRLFYAITRKQLTVDVEVTSYMFGDNGYTGNSKGSASFTIEDGEGDEGKIAYITTGTVHLVGEDLDSVSSGYTIKLVGVAFKYATLGKDGKVVSVDEATEVKLASGLPWLPGNYALTGTLHFAKEGGEFDEEYEEWTVKSGFTVRPRVITQDDIEWTDTEFTYNGKAQWQTASIITEIYEATEAGAKDALVNIEDISLTVVSADSNTYNLIYAGNHVVKVSAIKGDSLGYFILTQTDLTKTYNIKPKPVTVKGVEVNGHTYGDEITVDEKEFTHDGLVDGDGAYQAIVVTICKTGETTSIDRYAPVSGTYYVRVSWDPEYELYYNYEINWDNSAAFVIAKRDITVEWDNTGARSEYGKGVNLFNYLSPTEASHGGVENAYAGKKATDIFVLTAYNGNEPLTLGNKTDAGTYTVTPKLTEEAEGNWTIHYTDNTNADNWQYEIYNAQMSDPDNTITPVQGLEYSAKELEIFAKDSLEVKLVNSDLNRTTVKWWYGVISSLDDTSYENSEFGWKEMTDRNITRYTAGTYYFVIKATAKNHDALTKPVEVTIDKAILDVQFNYSIMYGEADPASKSVLFDAVRTRAVGEIGWTVSGFKQYGDVNDETLFYGGGAFYNLNDLTNSDGNTNGKARYTAVDFVIGDFKDVARRNYTIAYKDGETSLFTLKCDNYEFKLKEGTLKVNKIEITVQGKNLKSVLYNSTVPAINTEGTGYTVTHPASTYDKNTPHKPENGNYANYIHVSSPAFDNPNEGSKTASKGNYVLVVSYDTSDYYDITVQNGSVEITATELNVGIIGGYSGVGSEKTIEYNEKYYGLTVNAQETVDPDEGYSLGIAFATASDGTDIIIKFYVADKSYRDVSLNDTYLTGLETISGIPSYIDRGTYRIIYKIYTSEDTEKENYIPVFGYQEIIITEGTNELISGFNFRNNTVTESSNLNDAKVSWTYGYMVEDGFYPEGDQLITDAVAKFKRANASDTQSALIYELNYSKEADGVGASIVAKGKFASITAMFEKIFGADTVNEGETVNAGFNAGYYKLSVYMSLKETDNFSFTEVNYVFRVAKRNLTIKVDAKSTVYGEEAPALTYKDSGLVSNKKGAAADTINQAIGNTPSTATKYAVGKHVGYGSGEDENKGKYQITVDNKVATAQNYVVTYYDNWLTVTKREVTITIASEESKYNFQEATGPKELTFKLASSGSPYNIYEADRVKGESNPNDDFSVYNNKNQKVITLVTEALKGDTTNDVKFDAQGTIIGYTIYAVFNTEANEYAATDYLITFKGCDNKESDVSDAIKDGSQNNAGTYTIKQATVAIINNGIYHYVDNKSTGQKIQTDIYSGYINYYEVLLDGAKDKDGKNIAIPFTYYKYGTEEVVPQVINAGTYEARGSSTNLNYTALDMKYKVEIKQATIYLKANDATVEYGTTLYYSAAEDLEHGVVKADGSGRFTGFTYTAESGFVDSGNTIRQLPDEIVNYYLAGGDATVRYSCGDYSPTTFADTSVNLIPVCADTYGGNIKIDVSENTGRLNVIKRKVTVTIVGWDDNENNKNDKSKHNPQATCLYQGTADTLATEFNKKYTNNRSLFIYTNETETFGDAYKGKTIDYSALGISLSLPDTAVNVGKYGMSWTISKTTETFRMNYEVTVTNSINNKPNFYVQKANLTLYAYDKQYKTSVYDSVEYGETINRIVSGTNNSAGYLEYTVSGMLGDDSFVSDCLGSDYKVVFTVRAGVGNAVGKIYSPWESGVGQYTVYVGISKASADGTIEFVEDPFSNYVINNYVTASLDIKPRIISASTKSQEFEFDGDTYNDGLYGKSHEAVIEFTNVWTKREDADVDYSPVYTQSYNTPELKVDNNIYQVATKAPTVVGDYKVTVHLNKSGNYSFGDGVFDKELDFSVTQMIISAADLHWEDISIYIPENNVAETVSNMIKNYQAGYMKVAGFEFAPTGGNEVDLVEGDASTPGTYYFDGAGMLNITMYVTSIGRYNVRIELLSADAKHNIKLTSGTEDVDFVNVAFMVTASSVTMEITFSGFEYGEEPGIPTVYINSSKVTNNLVMRYARIDVDEENLSKVKGLCVDSYNDSGLTSAGVAGLSLGGYTVSPNFVVGYYVLYVQYSYSGEGGNIMQERYYVFAVTKKVIARPEVDTTDLTYNGRGQSIEVKYNATLMTPVFSGGTMIISGKGDKSYVTFTVTDAKDYTIQFVLVDGANTRWKSINEEDEDIDIGATLSFILKVLKDTDKANNPTDPAIKLIDRVADYGIPYSIGYVEILNSGYDGQITLYYMVNTDGIKPGVDADGWLEYERRAGRLNVGSYWIKAEVTNVNQNENFVSKATVGLFTVEPKEITVSVSGEITYGVKLTETSFTPLPEGLLGNDELILTGKIWEDGYAYKFVDPNYKIQAGGTYYIILETNSDGTVKGIDAGSNYKITPVEGLLTVIKRNVTVTIESDSSDYSVTPDIKAVNYSVDDMAPGEGKEVLGIEFYIGTDEAAATNRSAAGSYWITIKSYDDTNYVISYQRAVYTINPLQVEIQLEVQQDAYFEGEIWAVRPKENSLIISNPKADATFVYGELSKADGLKLEYSGLSNSGIPVPDKSKAPSLAGTYLVKVVGASDNYVLVGMPEFTFTINRRELDDGLLGIENQTYNGTALTPVVAVKGNEYALERFSFSAPECINANSYDVTVTLTDADNYQWKSTPGTSVVVKFIVDKANDEETTRLTITGWQYGNYSAAVNSPSAQVKSGGTIYYEYSADGGKTYTSFVPENGSVGTYYVRVVVAESNNYYAFEGTPVSFTITKYLLTVPRLTSEDIVYTGEELIATISDFDSRYMSVTDESDARTFFGASSITAIAINAGVYNIYIALSDFGNFGWLENAGDAQGVLTLTWTIGKKKVELPTAGKNRFVVNGNEIVYIPEGFDESIMSIENNVYSYGGNFTAEVRLKDTSNYEWINGEETVKLDWHITGTETVFAIILTVLLLCVAAGAAGIATQLLLERRRKRTEASTISDIESKDTENADNADNTNEEEEQK